MKRKNNTFKPNNSVPVIDADRVVEFIKDDDIVAIGGTGGGIAEATVVIEALANRYKKTKSPRHLTICTSAGLGDRADKGISPLAQQGLIKKAILAHWGQSPRIAEMAEREEIEAYNFPMGVMTQLFRTTAAGQPGLLTHIGLGTFMDPRQRGGKLNKITKKDLIELKIINGKEYLFYPSILPDVAILRGTTADTEGYITMEDEAAFLDNLALAMATHNNGGKVIVQVQRIVKNRTLHPKNIKIPGYLVDALVVIPNQPQLYEAPVNKFISGDYIEDEGKATSMPLTERKVVVRRALMEVRNGYIGNIGVGIADGIGIVAREESIDDVFTLTVETGPIGGISAQGIFFGASVNLHAMIDMPYQFDFYDGGGLDICFVSFAEFDQYGNVNVHKFNKKIMGTGGFINITQTARKVIFCGTFKASGLKVNIEDGQVKIEQEGKIKKIIKETQEITFNGSDAYKRGQEVLYITERAVFKLKEKGVELIEIAPGIDLETDIVSQMEFVPRIANNLKIMDKRLFMPMNMNIKEELFNI